MNSWLPILFNWLFYINFNIYFAVQKFGTYLTSEIPFKLASGTHKKMCAKLVLCFP